jgi:glycosyltransferase involved in cell wall biosynthesis
MKSKNLAFICAHYPQMGGVETVTGLLTDYFLSTGYSVSILTLRPIGQAIAESHKHASLLVEMPGPMNSPSNLDFLDAFVESRNIACVFNQGVFSTCYLRASKHPDTLFVNTLHSNPFWEVQKFMNSAWLPFSNVKTLLRHLLGLVHPRLSHPFIRSYYRKQIESSDWYVVLDASFKAELEKTLYKGVPQTKIQVMPNPIHLPATSIGEKKNDVLYVGRLAREQKRVDRMLRIWNAIEPLVPDWTLRIVGDGPDRNALEKMAEKLGLRQVSFEGLQDPVPFYEKAALLCLTSSYEGSPMVLPEAQSRGVVPIVFGSVSSFHNLLDDGLNGCIVEAFDEKAYSATLLKLIQDEKRRSEMSENAKRKVEVLELEQIGPKWLHLLEHASK